jgi:hypothetical protein
MKFKELLTFVMVIVVLLPCILVVNESDTFTPNIIGLAYVISLMLIAKTDFGKKMIDKIDKIIQKL